MIIAYLDRNPKNISVDAQRSLIESYAKNKKVSEVVFIENNDICTFKNMGKKEQTLVVANMACLGSNLEKIKDSLFSITAQKMNLISIEEGYELYSKKSADLLKGFEMAVDIKTRCNSLFMRNQLAQKRLNGGKLGRTVGAKNKRKSRCELNKDFIIQSLKNGLSKSAIARQVGVSTRTLYNFEQTLRQNGEF